MEVSFEDYQHPDRDHSLLARSYAKSAETFLDDVWAWAEREVIELKGRVEFVDIEHITGPSKIRIQALGGTVEEIRLRALNEAVAALKTQIERVKNFEYRDPCHAFALIQAYLIPIFDLVRVLSELRIEINAIKEAFDER